MKAVVIKEPGGPDKLIYTDVPTPKTKPGWSLVKMTGLPFNPRFFSPSVNLLI